MVAILSNWVPSQIFLNHQDNDCLLHNASLTVAKAILLYTTLTGRPKQTLRTVIANFLVCQIMPVPVSPNLMSSY